MPGDDRDPLSLLRNDFEHELWFWSGFAGSTVLEVLASFDAAVKAFRKREPNQQTK